MTRQQPNVETVSGQDESTVMTRLSPFVAREAELAWLHARWGQALRGDSVLVAVEGDVGVGKATLVDVFGAQTTTQGALFVSSRSYDTGLHIPYQPLIELLASLWDQLTSILGPDLPADLNLPTTVWAEVGRFVPEALLAGSVATPAPAIEGRIDQNRLHSGLCNFLSAVARVKPLVIALYDVQWADRSTLAFIHYLVHIGRPLNNSMRQPLMVVLTHRPDEIDDSHPLHHLLRGVRTNGRVGGWNGIQAVQRLQLAPLGQEAVGQWLMALLPGAADPALAHYLWEGCEGNPLFLLHTLADWQERHLLAASAQASPPGQPMVAAAANPSRWPALAPNVRSVLQQRRAGLSSNGHQLLLVLAVSNWPLDLELARRVLDWSPQTLQTTLAELAPTGLLWLRAEPRPERTASAPPENRVIGLSHSLIRRTIYDDTRADQARRLHRLLAGQLNAWHEQGDVQAAVKAAMHARLAGASDDDILPALMALAGWAFSLNALDSARELYWGALSQATQPGDTTTQMLIHRALGDIHELNGDYRAGLEHYQAALGCTGDVAEHILIRCRMAQVSLQHDDRENAAAHVQAACDNLPADLITTLPADLLTQQGEVMLRLGQLEKAQQKLLQARSAVETRGDVSSRIHLAHVLADLSTQTGQDDAALNLLQQVLNLPGPDLWQIRTHERLGEIHQTAGRLAEAEHHSALALEGFQRLGAWKQQAQLLTVLSTIYEGQGDMSRALARAREAVVIYRMLERIPILTH